ncbi:hypothetical protein Tco_0507936, partial [Tanacetum coccineum]
EIRKSSRIDDEVVQDQRQRGDNDLQDERQDQPKEEENQAIAHDYNGHDYEDLTRSRRLSASHRMEKDVEPTKEVSNSNSLDVLNLVENDVDLGTHGGTSNLASDHDSENEVESVDNDMTRFLASKKVGFGTNSLVEQ